MKPFKFFQNKESINHIDVGNIGFSVGENLREERIVSFYDAYDGIVFDRIRFIQNPIADVYRFVMNDESKAIIIRNITPDYELPFRDEVKIEYELYHIYLNQPNRIDTRIITMPVTEYNEIRYETL